MVRSAENKVENSKYDASMPLLAVLRNPFPFVPLIAFIPPIHYKADD